MREALRLLLGEELEKLVLMGLAKDGSEVGDAHSWKQSRFFVFADFSLCLSSLSLHVQRRLVLCKQRNYKPEP
jgi:hypothetical protein